MSNIAQSSQVVSTKAPDYYNNYLSNIANSGLTAINQGRYVGAQPLQQQAFTQSANSAQSQNPYFDQGQQLLNNSANINTAQLAKCYMNPYIKCAVNSMSDIANRNIQQNLSPMATAAAVGSGQFGSQRGAQVLGQVNANAIQCLNSNIANMEASGYNNALNAATQKQQNMNQSGLGLGTLGTQLTNSRVTCNNALAQLGTQQQQIQQNGYCFPLSQAAKYSTLLSGANIPTSTTTTLCMSPLSTAGAVGSTALGLFTPNSNGNTPISSAISGAKSVYNSLFGDCSSTSSPSNQYSLGSGSSGTGLSVPNSGCWWSSFGGAANGGSITSKTSYGCSASKNKGGLPSGSK